MSPPIPWVWHKLEKEPGSPYERWAAFDIIAERRGPIIELVPGTTTTDGTGLVTQTRAVFVITIHACSGPQVYLTLRCTQPTFEAAQALALRLYPMLTASQDIQQVVKVAST